VSGFGPRGGRASKRIRRWAEVRSTRELGAASDRELLGGKANRLDDSPFTVAEKFQKPCLVFPSARNVGENASSALTVAFAAEPKEGIIRHEHGDLAAEVSLRTLNDVELLRRRCRFITIRR